MMRFVLSAHGPVVAPAEVTVAEWLAALADRRALALSPSDARGWFGGSTLVAFDPVASGATEGVGEESLAAVGEVLERALHADSPLLAAALLPYSGDAEWALFDRGLVRSADGWRTWGNVDAKDLPTPLNATAPGSPLVTHVRSDTDAPTYQAAVEAVREAIRAGDVYVLNLTRTLTARTDHSPAQLFAELSARAPATMAAAWVGGSRSVLSCSPERFVRLLGHEIEIAPVKGTRPRAADPTKDAALAADLLGSEKERAEHVMIVDLERNDLARVCVPGSVTVDPLFAIETTSYCHQTVSSVRGLLRPNASIGDVLLATFPCGSITGAPKIAAMRIAEQLESGPRGIYTGSLVVAVPGALDSSVLIRTAEQRGSEVRYGTGCGITIDSNAAEEWQESVLKTEPLLGSGSCDARPENTDRGA